MAHDLEVVDRSLLCACDLAEAVPLIEARGRLISDLLRQAAQDPSEELGLRLRAAIERGDRISTRLARLRRQVSEQLHRAEQCRQMMG